MSNYVRLFVLLLLSILFVPILLLGVGDEGFGLIGLLGASIGIAEMVDVIVKQSMNRELGAAYNSKDPKDFPEAYICAMLLCGCLAVVAAIVFAILYFLLPFFSISDDLFPAAQYALLCFAALSILRTLFGAQINMYVISERMIMYSVWIISKKVADFVVALVLFVILGMRDPVTGLIAFVSITVGLRILLTLISLGTIIWLEPRLIPRSLFISRSVLKEMIATAGWNTLVLTAMNLHIRLDHIIMNMWFGLTGSASFTLAVRLTSYVRIIAFANTLGIDVVSARLSVTESMARVGEVMAHATRLHAVVALPTGMLVIMLADPLLTLWVGRTIQDPNTLAIAAVLSKVLVIGMTARGISDCWLRMLYGAGFVKTYAPLVFLGGIINPIAAISLIYLLPQSVNYLGPALAFAGIFVVIHFTIIPFIAARCLSLSVGEIMMPVLQPAIATLVASPLLLIPFVLKQPYSPIVLIATIGLFCTAMSIIAWFYVFDQVDRERVSGAIMRRIKRSSKPRPKEQHSLMGDRDDI